MNKYTKYQMKVPGLSKLRTIGATSEDMKKKVNDLQRQKRSLRMAMNSLENEINLMITEINKVDKTEEYNND